MIGFVWIFMQDPRTVLRFNFSAIIPGVREYEVVLSYLKNTKRIKLKRIYYFLISFVCLLFESKAQNLHEADSIRFWSTIRPIEDSMGKAYSFWEISAKAKWEGINTDSVYNEYSGLRNQYLVRFGDFIKANRDNLTALKYFSLYY